MARVLGRIRLSRLTEESTSVERQREIIEQWAAMGGHRIIDWAVDLDVSRSVDPFETPSLGPWLSEPDKIQQWDVVACWKLDRLATGSIYLNAVMSWCQRHDKTLVSVTENLDLSTWVGRMVANVIAGVAEGELEAIKERTGASQAKLRQVGRWHGGMEPYGYRAVKRSDGWYLEVNQEESKVIRDIIAAVKKHRSTNSIAEELNDRKVPTRKGKQWAGNVIRSILRSRTLLGQHAHSGKVVTDSDGMPLQRAEPIVSYSDWKEIRDILESRSFTVRASKEDGLLSGVAFCSLCGAPLYAQIMKDRGYRYIRCPNRGKGCESKAMHYEWLEGATEEALLERIGGIERRERVYIGGQSFAEELDQVEAAIQTARKENELGLYEGEQDEYLDRVKRLVERRRTLQSLPEKAPGYEWRGLGETYGQAWERMKDDVAERRALLKDSGITVKASYPPLQAEISIPEHIMEQRVPGFVSTFNPGS